MVPVRAPPGFAATLNLTVSLPRPIVPPVTVIHAALLVAVQAQSPAAVTDSDRPVPPLEGTVCAPGLKSYVHGDGDAATPACVTMDR